MSSAFNIYSCKMQQAHFFSCNIVMKYGQGQFYYTLNTLLIISKVDFAENSWIIRFPMKAFILQSLGTCIKVRGLLQKSVLNNSSYCLLEALVLTLAT